MLLNYALPVRLQTPLSRDTQAAECKLVTFPRTWRFTLWKDGSLTENGSRVGSFHSLGWVVQKNCEDRLGNRPGPEMGPRGY